MVRQANGVRRGHPELMDFREREATSGSSDKRETVDKRERGVPEETLVSRAFRELLDLRENWERKETKERKAQLATQEHLDKKAYAEIRDQPDLKDQKGYVDHQESKATRETKALVGQVELQVPRVTRGAREM